MLQKRPRRHRRPPLRRRCPTHPGRPLRAVPPLRALTAAPKFTDHQATQIPDSLLAVERTVEAFDRLKLIVFKGFPREVWDATAAEASAGARRKRRGARTIRARRKARSTDSRASRGERQYAHGRRQTFKAAVDHGLGRYIVAMLSGVTGGKTLKILSGPLALLAEQIPVNDTRATEMMNLCKYPLLCGVFISAIRNK